MLSGDFKIASLKSEIEGLAFSEFCSTPQEKKIKRNGKIKNLIKKDQKNASRTIEQECI